MKNSNAKEVDSYDTRGRINAQWQCTPLNCGSSWFNLTYGYNYAGGLISESTPMGFTLTPAYDSAARLKSLTSSWSDAQHPATLLSVDQSVGGWRTLSHVFDRTLKLPESGDRRAGGTPLNSQECF